jgi:hypothetical protein
MGDRTYVTIQIPKECLETAIGCLPGFDFKTEMDDSVLLEFSEINYGELEEFTDLIALGIPCDYEWGNGSEYGSGRKYLRFTPEGEMRLVEYYDEDYNPPLYSLMERIDNPEELVKFIKEHKEEVTPLPWDNQVEYGKIFRARQLLLQNN